MIELTLQVLRDLNAVRENILTLSDKTWLWIDHNDSDTMKGQHG